MENQLFQRLLRLEIDYLDDLIQLFQLYYEPLKKTSTFLKHDQRFVFSQMEPFLSFSCMVKHKIETIIKNQDYGDSFALARLYSKPLLRSYEEYIKNLPRIIRIVREQCQKDPEISKLILQRAKDDKPPLPCYMLRPVKQLSLYKVTFAKLLKCRVLTPYIIDIDYWDLYNLIKSIDQLLKGANMFHPEDYGNNNSQPRIQIKSLQNLQDRKDASRDNLLQMAQPLILNNNSEQKELSAVKGEKGKQSTKKRSRSTLGPNKTVKRLYSSSSKAVEHSTVGNNKKRHILQVNTKFDIARNKSKILTMPPPSNTENFPQSRTYITEGFATISQGSHSAQRYIFLFNDWLIIAKSKANNVFHLKKKIRVAEIWVMKYASGVAEVSEGLELLSFIIGWPTVNSVITFGSLEIRKYWWDSLQKTIKSQCEKEEPKMTALKVFNWNIDCPIKAKTMQIRYDQTATECLDSAIKLFGISSSNDVGLWVQNQKKGRSIELAGHERPYAIIMNHIRKVSGAFENPQLPFCCRDDSALADSASDALTNMIREAGISAMSFQTAKSIANVPTDSKSNVLPFQLQQLLEGNLSTMCCQFSLRSRFSNAPHPQNLSFEAKTTHTLSQKDWANKGPDGLEPESRKSPLTLFPHVNLNNWASFKKNFHKTIHHTQSTRDEKSKTLQTSLSPSHNNFKFTHKFSQIIMARNHKSENLPASTTDDCHKMNLVDGLYFNRPLCDIMTNKNQELPRPVKKILQLLYTYGPYTIGIFRKSASAKLCKLVKEQIDAGVNIKLDDVPILALATVFKEFLRNVPSSLMDCRLYEQWLQIQEIEDNKAKFMRCKWLINNLPDANRLLLGHTLRIFKCIHDNSDYNNMTAFNLGICVGQSLLWHPINHSLDVALKLLKSDPNMNSNAYIKCLPDDGTKIIPLLIEYLIIHINELIPSVAKISPSFRIKFNSSRQKKKVSRASSLLKSKLNLKRHIIDVEDDLTLTYSENASPATIQNAGDTPVISLHATNQHMIVPPSISYNNSQIITTHCSGLSSPASALSLPASLSRLLSPSTNSNVCLIQTRRYPVIPKLSINGLDVMDSPLSTADSLRDCFASDFGVSLSSLETKYDFKSSNCGDGTKIQQHIMSSIQPCSLTETTDRSQSIIHSSSQENSQDQIDSIGDSDSFHSLQDHKKDDYQRYNSSIDSLEINDKDDIYIYAKNLYHNHCPYFLKECKRTQEINLGGGRDRQKPRGFCANIQGSSQCTKHYDNSCIKSKKIALDNVTIISPLTSSSRDSGLTLSDSNLYNTEPELEEDVYDLNERQLKKRLSQGGSLGTSPSYAFGHSKQRASLRNVGIDNRLLLRRHLHTRNSRQYSKTRILEQSMGERSRLKMEKTKDTILVDNKADFSLNDSNIQSHAVPTEATVHSQGIDNTGCTISHMPDITYRKKSSSHAEVSISYISPWERKSCVKIENSNDSNQGLNSATKSGILHQNNYAPDNENYKINPTCIKSENLDRCVAQSQKSSEARKIYENSLKLYIERNQLSSNENKSMGHKNVNSKSLLAAEQKNLQTNECQGNGFKLTAIDEGQIINGPKEPADVRGTWSVSQLTQLFANMVPNPGSSSGNFLTVRQNASRIRTSASFYEKTSG